MLFARSCAIAFVWVAGLSLLLAGCGDGNFNLGASDPGAGGSAPTTPPTTGGSTVGGTFSLTSPAGVTATQVNMLNNATNPSVAHGSDFSFEADHWC